MIRLATLALMLALPAAAQEPADSREMLGQLGARASVIRLYALPRTDGSWRVTGEYLVLATLQRRYLEGDRSKQLGVMFLKEGGTPILYGRTPSATLQGTWVGGVFKGTRYAPGGQERERFEFSERFPAMHDYTAEARCAAAEGRYSASLAYAVAGGKLKSGSLEWRATLSPNAQGCAIGAQDRVEQVTFDGGLRFAAGQRCKVTLRDLGEFIRVAAEDCAEFCGAQAYFEPLLVERRGGCKLLLAQQR